jgi:hypothetical protein
MVFKGSSVDGCGFDKKKRERQTRVTHSLLTSYSHFQARFIPPSDVDFDPQK